MFNTNQYLAIVYNGETVLTKIPCRNIRVVNSVTEVNGIPDSGSVGYEVTLAVIPSNYIVLLGEYKPYATPKESIEAFTQ